MSAAGSVAKYLLKNKGAVLNGGIGAWSGMATYQDKREQGAGKLSAAASAGLDMALPMMMSFKKYMGLQAAMNLPGLAYDAYKTANDFRRQLGRENSGQAFANAIPQCTPGVKAVHRILEYHLHLGIRLFKLLAFCLRNLLARQKNPARSRRDKAGNHAGHGGLAAATFTDNGQFFPCRKRKAHIIHRDDFTALLPGKNLFKMPDLQNLVHKLMLTS